MAGVHIYAAMAAVVTTAFVILHTDVWFDKAGKYYQQPYHDKPVAEICLPDDGNANVPGLNCSDCAWLDNKVSFADSPFSLAQISKDSDEAPPGLSACGYPRHSLSSNRDYHSVVESSAKPERRHSATNHPKCAKRLKVGPGLFAPVPAMIKNILEGSEDGDNGSGDGVADSSEWCDGKAAPKNTARCAAFVRNVARQHLAALAPSNPMLRANPKRRDGVGREEVDHRGKAHRMFAARARDFCGKSAEVGWPSFSATTPPANDITTITDSTSEAHAAMAQLTSKKRKIAADTWLGAMKHESGNAKGGSATSCSMQKRWADGPTDKTLIREAKEFLAMVTMGYYSRSTTNDNRGSGRNSIWLMCDDMFERARIKATGSFTKTAPTPGPCNQQRGPLLSKYNAEITGKVGDQWATEDKKVNLDAAFQLATLISWSDDERINNCGATTTITTTDSSTATTTPTGNTTAVATTTPTTPVNLSPGQGPDAYKSCNIVTPWDGVEDLQTLSVDFGMFDIKCESSARSRFVGTCMHTALHTCPKESCGMQDAIRDYLREGKELDRCYGTTTCTSVDGNTSMDSVSGAIIYNDLKYMPSLKAEDDSPPTVTNTLQEVIWPPNNHGGDTILSMSEAYEDGVRWFVARWSTTLFSTLVTMFVVLAAIAWKMGHEIPARIMVSLAGVTVFVAMLFMYYGAYGKGIGDHVPRSVDYMGGTDDANFGALTYGAAITHPRAAATVSLMAVLALLAFVKVGNDDDKTKAVSMGVFVSIFLLCLMDALAIMLGGQGDSVSEDHMCRSNFRLVLWWAIGGSLAAVSLAAAALTYKFSLGDKMKFYLAAIVVILVLRHPFFLLATKIPANRACLPSVLSSQMFKAGTFGTHLITIGALAAMAIVTDSELEASTSSMGSSGMYM